MLFFVGNINLISNPLSVHDKNVELNLLNLRMVVQEKSCG